MSFRHYTAVTEMALLLASPVVADPGMWVGKWFKVTIALNRQHLTSSGVRPDRERGTAYGII